MKRLLWRRQLSALSKSFTLVEVTIYLALSSVLTCLALSLLNQTSLSFTQRSTKYEEVVRTVIFIDLLKRDLAQASMLATDWVSPQTTFKQEFLDQRGQRMSQWVHWSVGTDGLIRSYGLYEPVKKEWLGYQTDFFGCGVTAISFKPTINHDTGCVESVTVIYEQHAKTYQATVRPYNKIII
ncbi:hypothetical protein IPF37_00435 [bacterium]|nr:MAG: hypothetical protein IPF37_00435 [bacterium]